MATKKDFIEYICDQIYGVGNIRYKMMFGEYMVYINDKPILLVCDNIVYVKILDEISNLMNGAQRGFPYNGSKEHYILDIDNIELTKEVILELEKITPLPKLRKKK